MQAIKSKNGWIAVDLDGTLAEYHGFVDAYHIGPPIPLMAQRVRQWLDEGKDVRIFTARADGGLAVSAEGNEAGQQFRDVAKVVANIQDWTEKHFGVRLPVTNAKDYAMVELWDDRCKQVVKNTGEAIEEKLTRELRLNTAS